MADRSKRGQSAAPTDEAPPMGHNRGPSLLQLLQENLTETYLEEIAKADPIAAAANSLCDPKTHKPIPIASDEDAAKWGKVYLDADKLFKSLDVARKNEKRPYGDLIDEHFKSSTERLERIKSAARDASNAWTRKKADDERARQIAERKRLDAEAAEARRIAEEAAAFGETEEAQEAEIAASVAEQKAAAPAPRPTAAAAVDLGGGASSGGRQVWKFELVDAAKIDLNALRMFFTPDDVSKAVGKYLRQQKEHAKLEGVRFYQDTETVFRK